MTFIESWLGVSPDGGDGSLEALYLALAAAAAVLWLARRRLARRPPARCARERGC